MKQHRTRQRHSHGRNDTPSVICLPPPSQPAITGQTPLARNRSPAPTRTRLVTKLTAWLHQPAWHTPKRHDTTAISQLQALRDEVAALQISLDRALEGVTAQV